MNDTSSRWVVLSAYSMALFYVAAGVMHFVTPEFYVAIVPPQLPWPEPVVYASGLVEIGLGCGLVAERTRRWAAAGVIALLIAVYPANLHMWLNDVRPLGSEVPGWFHPLRALGQVMLVAWAWWQLRRAS